jgi:hypothetical protein
VVGLEHLGKVTQLVPVVPVVVAHKALEILVRDQELQDKDLMAAQEILMVIADIQQAVVVVLVVLV